MLTVEQQATLVPTMRHIERVRNLLNMAITDLLRRGEEHDQSKLVSPEAEAYANIRQNLAGLTYGSPEYAAQFKQPEMRACLDHHYANNAHHPQHWPEGVNDMTLLDILEMFVDWKAASEQHNDGNILKSIEINAERYGLAPQLARIFRNTAKMFDGK